MTHQEISELLSEGYDCGQITLLSAAMKLGMSREEALSMAAGFGGGMLSGETCGAVVGALIAIGCREGTWAPGDLEAKNRIMGKIAAFRAKFVQKEGSCLCRDLLGYNLAVPEEAQKIAELGLTEKKCPDIIASAVELLEEFI